MSEQELERQAKDRLQVIRHAKEVTGNVAFDPHVVHITRVASRRSESTRRARQNGTARGEAFRALPAALLQLWSF